MKIKLIIFLFLSIIPEIVLAQDKLITKTGHVWFYSHAALEDIEAHSHQAVAICLPEKGSIAVTIPIMSFEFKKALMQEHFNENYMESAKYPKAKFLGSVVNFQNINLKKNGIYNAMIEGDLTIHNVTKKIKTEGTIEVRDGKINAKSYFKVEIKDYNIAVENRLINNIASTIEININLEF